LLEADRGPLTVHGHRVGETVEERDAVVRQRDVLGQRKQSPDATGCTGGGCEFVGGVALYYANLSRWFDRLHEVCDGATYCSAPDDGNIDLHCCSTLSTVITRDTDVPLANGRSAACENVRTGCLRRHPRPPG